MKYSNFPLILTSTIEVRNKAFRARNDTSVRLEDYKNNLRKWMRYQQLFQNIVFVDNSGCSLSELEEIADETPEKKVEFLSFDQRDYLKKGPSFGELESIGYALGRSKVLKSSKYFAKATGRIFIKNMDAIVGSLPKEFDFVSNFNNNLSYTDTTVIFFCKKAYQEVIHDFAIDNICDDEREYLERAFAKAIMRGIIRDYRWYPLPEYPVIDGMSGTKNKPYPYNSRLKSFRDTLISKLYYNLETVRTSYGNNRVHLMDQWRKPRKKS